MSGSVTVSVRSILGTAVVLVGLVAAYLMGGAGGGSLQAAQATGPATGSATGEPATGPAPATSRTVTMVGRGEATAVPDQLRFAVGVGVTRDDLETALDDASRTMARVLAALTPYGVRRADVQSTDLSMYPVYDYHQYSAPTLRGYRVSQRAAVLVRELKQGGKAVSAAVAAGGNSVRVSDITLSVGDPAAVMARARAAAVAEATAKARQYAAAAGQHLGEVLTLREVGSSNRSAIRPQSYSLTGLRTADAARMPVPIRPGKDDLVVRVRLVWEFA